MVGWRRRKRALRDLQRLPRLQRPQQLQQQGPQLGPQQRTRWRRQRKPAHWPRKPPLPRPLQLRQSPRPHSPPEAAVGLVSLSIKEAQPCFPAWACLSLPHFTALGSCFTGSLAGKAGMGQAAAVGFCEAHGGFLAAPHTVAALDAFPSGRADFNVRLFVGPTSKYVTMVAEIGRASSGFTSSKMRAIRPSTRAGSGHSQTAPACSVIWPSYQLSKIYNARIHCRNDRCRNGYLGP